MKVSVLITTYNQEAYIAQAVESALTQRLEFEYEIVISEDASSDRTREFVLEMESRHPEKIRVMLQDRVEAERDRSLGVGGKTSFTQGLRACRAQYVAMLDGDDYWTDAHKLQKQVNFLDSHPDYAICFHNAEILYEGIHGGRKTFSSPSQKETSTIEDLISGNYLFSGSVMFRNHLFDKLPEWFNGLMMGDWTLHVMNAQYGKVRYLNEVMAAYRVHRAGFWSSSSSLQQARDRIRILDCLDAHLDAKYQKPIQDALANAYQQLSEAHYQQGERNKSIEALRTSLRICLANHSVPNRQLIGRLLKLQLYPLLKTPGHST